MTQKAKITTEQKEQAIATSGKEEVEQLQQVAQKKDNTEAAEQKDSSETQPEDMFSDISLNVVKFDREFSRNKGTLSQIVLSLKDMSERLVPGNPYQEGLYPVIKDICMEAYDSYNELLGKVDAGDYYVFGYYLNGHRNNGQMRSATSTDHEKRKYKVSEIKETFKSMNDRLRHIKGASLRSRRDKTRTNQEVFQRLITFCDDYHVIVDKQLKKWDDFLVEYREKRGVVKKVETEEKSGSKNKKESKEKKKRVNLKKTTYKVKAKKEEDVTEKKKDKYKKKVVSKKDD